eukprot:3444985-Pyramimonas_sp.AAC.1
MLAPCVVRSRPGRARCALMLVLIVVWQVPPYGSKPGHMLVQASCVGAGAWASSGKSLPKGPGQIVYAVLVLVVVC